MSDAAARYPFFEYLPNAAADTLLLAYGIVFRVVLPLRKTYSLFKPVRMFPLLEDEIRSAAASHRRVVVVEMNDGQYAGEVQRVLKRDVRSIPILGGEISLREIKERLHDL
jgi:2-oxoglutarate ferredoxin oxidoreductase subunit alpha